MEGFRRALDGRPMFTAQFKQEQLARIDQHGVTVAELARELSVSPHVVRQWQRLSTTGSATAVRRE